MGNGLIGRMSDEELADRLCIVLKDVNRTAAKLREDKLLKTYHIKHYNLILICFQ